MPKAPQYNPNAPSDSERLTKGVAYSPNNKFLYVIGQFNIWQFDFADSSWYHVAGMDTTFMSHHIMGVMVNYILVIFMEQVNK
ncbi:MAG: hypothetical protein IPL09_05135 [Bacteroidetes bacterium]|nr:hypothetical protein [Bacteroidota bacterium]